MLKTRRKSEAPRRKSAAARRKSDSRRLPTETIPLQPAPILDEKPEARYRPEFLGQIWSLGTHVPPYAPRHEEDLVTWLENFVASAYKYRTTFSTVFTQPGLDFLSLSVASLRAALTYIAGLAEFHKAYTSFKNIVFYLREPQITGLNPPTPPKVPPPGTVQLLGVVAYVDERVQMLRKHPSFTQVMAEEFGTIPPAPPAGPDPATLNPNLRVRNMGGSITGTFRSPVGLRGVAAVRVRVERDKAQWEDLIVTRLGRFTDNHPQPERPCAWIYQAWYVNANGDRIGHVSEAAITARA